MALILLSIADLISTERMATTNTSTRDTSLVARNVMTNYIVGTKDVRDARFTCNGFHLY